MQPRLLLEDIVRHPRLTEAREVFLDRFLALYPEHDYRSIMQHDPRFHGLYRRISIGFLPLAASLLLSLPDTMLFFNHAAGAVIQAELLRTAMNVLEYRDTAVPYADVGKRFGVSRTHVRQLLLAAEAADLVQLHTRGGRSVQILPRQWASCDHGMAVGMYLRDLVHVATERAIQPASAPPTSGSESELQVARINRAEPV